MNITEIKLSESVLRIGESAFYGCEKLKKIFIPRNVEEIAGNIF